MHIQFSESVLILSVCVLRTQNLSKVFPKLQMLLVGNSPSGCLHSVLCKHLYLWVTFYFLMGHCSLCLLYYIQKHYNKLQFLLKVGNSFNSSSSSKRLCNMCLVLIYTCLFFNFLCLGIWAAYESWLTYFPKAGKHEMNWQGTVGRETVMVWVTECQIGVLDFFLSVGFLWRQLSLFKANFPVVLVSTILISWEVGSGPWRLLHGWAGAPLPDTVLDNMAHLESGALNLPLQAKMGDSSSASASYSG